MDTILIVDDEKNYLILLEALLCDEGYEVIITSSPQEALKIVETREIDLIITDMKMPGISGMELMDKVHRRYPEIPVIMMTAYATVEKAVEAMKKGAFDYITKPFRNEELKLTIKKAINMRKLMEENRLLSEKLKERYQFGAIIGKSKSMRRIYDIIQKVAPTKATVLVTGESGTGKELIAKAIHQNSPRKDQPFISINCGALPETLLESELFGHEKGAFSGAVSLRKGRFELADGGTLFLDEISETSPSLQVKLLRVLQEMEFERVGGGKTLKVDVRVIAASNTNLKQEAEAGRFRMDLYYRLNVVHIHVPPLRERPDDIPLLINHFLDRMKKETGRKDLKLNNEALRRCLLYHWPGNVRELENTIERSVIMARGNEIGPEDLPPEIWSVEEEPKDTVESVIPDTSPNFHDPIVPQEGDLIPSLGLNQRQVKAINFVKTHGFITNEYYTKINKVSERHGRRELSQMVSMGVLKRIGRGPSVRYVLSQE